MRSFSTKAGQCPHSLKKKQSKDFLLKYFKVWNDKFLVLAFKMTNWTFFLLPLLWQWLIVTTLMILLFYILVTEGRGRIFFRISAFKITYDFAAYLVTKTCNAMPSWKDLDLFKTHFQMLWKAVFLRCSFTVTQIAYY